MKYKTFCIGKDVEYREEQPKCDFVNKFYVVNNPSHKKIVAVPDGCTDIQFAWVNDHCELYVCDSFLLSTISPVTNYEKCFGIKLNPGISCERAKDSVTSPAESRFPMELTSALCFLKDAMTDLSDFSQMVALFEKHFQFENLYEYHALTLFIMKKIQKHKGNIDVKSVIENVGYSHRYINRIFKKDTGMSIKKYADIVRIQQAILFLQKQKKDDVYEDLGYYDQSHFIHEFKYFTSLTPCYYQRKMQAKDLMIV